MSLIFSELLNFLSSCRVSFEFWAFQCSALQIWWTNLAMCTCSHMPNLKNIALRSLPGQFNRHSNLNSFDLNNSQVGAVTHKQEWWSHFRSNTRDSPSAFEREPRKWILLVRMCRFLWGETFCHLEKQPEDLGSLGFSHRKYYIQMNEINFVGFPYLDDWVCKCVKRHKLLCGNKTHNSH